MGGGRLACLRTGCRGVWGCSRGTSQEGAREAGVECESEPPWSGEPERRSGSDETELVSSLESKPLSLELSVGNCSSFKMEDLLLFGPRVITGGHFFAREIFSRGSREITKQLPEHHARSLSNPGFCAAPRLVGAGLVRTRVQPRERSQRELLSCGAPRGGEPARQPRELGSARSLPGLRLWVSFQGAIDGVIPPQCTHLLPLQKKEKKFVVVVLFCFLNRHL